MKRIAFVFLGLSLAACSKSKPSASSSPNPTAAAPPAGSTASGRRQPGMHMGLQPITVEEVTPLVPTPTGANVSSPPAKMPTAERVQLAWCFDSPTLDDAKKNIETALTPAGWQIVWRPAPNQTDMVALVAHKDDMMLTGSVGKLPGSCPGVVANVGVMKHSGAGPHRPIGPGGLHLPLPAPGQQLPNQPPPTPAPTPAPAPAQ